MRPPCVRSAAALWRGRAADKRNRQARARSAAHHGWEQKQVPGRPEITLPRNRKLGKPRRKGLAIHWSDLPDDDVDGWVTTKERTLLDCCRSLPFDEALAIADSALRHGDITNARLAAPARAALRTDARRYNAFVVAGWPVLRFAWEDVMHDQEYVVGVLRALAGERTHHARCACRCASR